MTYHLLDERPVTLGAGGLTVWTEGGWPLTVKTKLLFNTVADEEGRVFLLNHAWRLRILKRTLGATPNYRRDFYYMAMSRKGPLFWIYPMLRLQSVLRALR